MAEFQEFSDYHGPQGAVLATGTQIVPMSSPEFWLAIYATIPIIAGLASD
jgi:hypothetical protein